MAGENRNASSNVLPHYSFVRSKARSKRRARLAVTALIDGSISRTPADDALANLDALDAGIAAGDRTAIRRAAGDVAEAFAELVRAAQLHVPNEAHQVLTRLLPAFRALDDVHTAVRDGESTDAAAAAAAVRASFDTFTAWHQSVSG